MELEDKIKTDQGEGRTRAEQVAWGTRESHQSERPLAGNMENSETDFTVQAGNIGNFETAFVGVINLTGMA